MPPIRSRRALLASFGSLLVAGCPADGQPATTPARSPTPSSGPGESVDDDPATASAPTTCPDGYTPVDPWWVVEGPGPLGGFELALESDEVALGGTLRATVTNAADATRTTGSKAKMDVQRRSDDGWRSIYGMEGESVGYWDDIAEHEPGTGFSYELPISQEGLSNPVFHEPQLYACTPIEPGTYRFVYWGLGLEAGPEYRDGNYRALGKTFTVTDA